MRLASIYFGIIIVIWFFFSNGEGCDIRMVLCADWNKINVGSMLIEWILYSVRNLISQCQSRLQMKLIEAKSFCLGWTGWINALKTNDIQMRNRLNGFDSMQMKAAIGMIYCNGREILRFLSVWFFHQWIRLFRWEPFTSEMGFYRPHFLSSELTGKEAFRRAESRLS